MSFMESVDSAMESADSIIHGFDATARTPQPNTPTQPIIASDMVELCCTVVLLSTKIYITKANNLAMRFAIATVASFFTQAWNAGKKDHK